MNENNNMKCGKCGNDEYTISAFRIESRTLDTIYEIRCKECSHATGYMKFTYLEK
jgi:predicted nucleic-acid-binding Zn-ribbon protein